MINVETIKFVRLLDELAALSKNGIESFENANNKTFGNKVFYDARELEGEEGYKVVLDACIIEDLECYHHDIVAYYDSDSLEYKVRVIIDEESAYMTVTLLLSGDIIVIENGTWYFA